MEMNMRKILKRKNVSNNTELKISDWPITFLFSVKSKLYYGGMERYSKFLWYSLWSCIFHIGFYIFSHSLFRTKYSIFCPIVLNKGFTHRRRWWKFQMLERLIMILWYTSHKQTLCLIFMLSQERIAVNPLKCTIFLLILSNELHKVARWKKGSAELMQTIF